MSDAEEKVLYVGKARNLKKRVASYYRPAASTKTIALVNRIANIQVTVTNSETEALLLEHNLIKEKKPPFNIIFRDDKSYPYIYASTQHPFPALRFYRGAKVKHGQLLGPWPSATIVRKNLTTMQKLFRVRHCEDSIFKHRSRPCLQHQIGRCSAPCVNLISQQEYAQDIRRSIMFLEGKNQKILAEFKAGMASASARLDFETAAKYRDQIRSLNKMQQGQDVNVHAGNTDIIAVAQHQAMLCIVVLFIRSGQMLDQRSWFPKSQLDNQLGDVLAAFLSQFYLSRTRAGNDIPKNIVLNQTIPDKKTLQTTIAAVAGHKITLSHQVKGQRARWSNLATENAQQALIVRTNKQQTLLNQFVALQENLHLSSLPKRLECFDISHISGTKTVASCVVFDQNGPLKSDYRRFNIDNIQPGDDYAAMYQAIERRYKRLKKEGLSKLPDVLFVDGGKGQVKQAQTVLRTLNIQGIALAGVAKGEGRKARLDRVIVSPYMTEVPLDAHSGAMHLIQYIRDEAHRFAIAGHRQRRSRSMNYSELEDIPGIGQKRRQQLLQHFGGIDGVKEAGVRELTKTPGISRILADSLYGRLHDA